MGIRLRQSPTGQELLGDVINNTVKWDDVAKRWNAAPGSSALAVFANFLFVNLSAPAGGDGSIDKPFNNSQDAVDAAVDGAILLYAPGDYTAQGRFTWGGGLPFDPLHPTRNIDKNLVFWGFTPFNQATGPFTKGIFPAPVPSAPFVLTCQANGINFHPFNSAAMLWIVNNCNCHPEDTSFSNYILQGNNQYNDFTQQGFPLSVGSVTGIGSIVDSLEIHGACDLNGSIVRGPTSFPNVGSGTSAWSNCRIESGTTVDVQSNGLYLYGCTFNGPCTFTGNIFVDKSTYQRGLYWGVQWPGTVTIIGQNQLTQPGYVNSGTPDSGSGGTLHPAIGHTQTGDRLVMITQELGAPGVANPANTPAGWTSIGTILVPGTNSGLQVFTRDTVAAGDEFGATVAVTWAAGSAVNIAQISTFRNCSQLASFTELVATSTNTVGVANGPSLNPTGQGRLAVACFGSNELATIASIAGAVGGIWVDRQQQQAGLGSTIDMQTAGIEVQTGISGGSAQFGSNTAAIAGISFCIIGAPL